MIGARAPATTQTFGRGLEGLVAGDTRVSDIDGVAGRLWYRGYAVEDLAARASFEETSFLILRGELPDRPALAAWGRDLRAWRVVPEEAMAVLGRLPAGAHPLAQFRTAMTVAACLIPEAEDTSVEAQWRRPARILSWTAGLAAASIRHMAGLPPIEPRDDLGYAAHFLWLALGRAPDAEAARAFEVSLIVQAEHGLHAAALAALVVASTGADLGSAVLAGMGALSGAIHGGANQTAFEILRSLPSPDAARAWARDRLREGFRFPGFGHRVYKTHDPRARILEPYARRSRLWAIHEALKDEVETALSPKGIYLNVDGITGLVYHPVGLPPESFPIAFCLAIQTGWMAHCLEYVPEGRVIEPETVYIG
jgi:citrate synthase